MIQLINRLTQINQLMTSSVNKIPSQRSSALKPEKQKQSIGIGDYYANPQRQIVHWVAHFYEGKFYLTDPNTYERLQEVQAQLDLQKKIASQYVGSQKEKAESVRGIDPKLQTSVYTIATEHNPQKSKLKQIKAEKALYDQEQMNFKRIVEAKHKKKVEKRPPTKNLIQVKKHKKDDALSEKDKIVKEVSDKNDILNQTMMNKLEVPKNACVPTPVKQNEAKASQNIIIEEIPTKQTAVLNGQSVINIDPNQYNPNQQCVLQSAHKKELRNVSAKDPNSYCQKIVIPLPESVLKTQVKKTEHLKVVSDRSFNDDQSLILNKIEIGQQQMKDQDPSILNMGSQQELKLEQNLNKQERAGNSFFSQINRNLDSIDKDGKKEVKNKKETEQAKPIVNSRDSKKNYHASETLQETKNILKQLEGHFNKLEDNSNEVKEPSERSLNNTPVEELTNNKIIEQNMDISKVNQKQKTVSYNNPSIIPISTAIQVEESSFKKKKEFRVTSSLVNYQIANPVIKKEQNPQSNEKQRLQKQIGVLQQVIGQLRVQRQKYQQNNSKNSQSALYSHFERSQRDPHDRRFNNTPETFNKTHRPAATHLTNFDQSVVSQFQSGTRSHLMRNKSGKIVKNLSTDKKSMPQIKQQFIKEEKSKQIKNKNASELPKKQQQSVQVSQLQQFIQQNGSARLQEEKNTVTQNDIEQYSNLITHQKADANQFSKTKEQYKFKITTIDSKRRSTISEPKRQTSNQVNTGSVVFHGDTPLPNKSRVSQISNDTESPMPKRLINKYNFSTPPRISVQEHQRHKKIAEESAQKKLMNNFDKLQRQSTKKLTPSQQAIDPKRRAIRQGMLKNIQTKTLCNPETSKTHLKSSLKQRVSRVQNTSKDQPHGSQVRNQSKSIKNFRMRKDTETSRQSSRTRNKSCGVCESKVKKEEKMMYVPAVEDNKTFNNNDISQPNESQFCEVRFDQIQTQSQLTPHKGFKVAKRNITFSNLEVPKFPEPPNPNITVEDMAELIRKLCTALNQTFQNSQIHKIIMKKYKNCIMLDLPTRKSLKLVWHYNGKLYVGEWDETSMTKTGEGVEYTPQKFYYKGQFHNNKKNGTGVMLFHNGSRYEGQWQEGERCGRGKYQDRPSKYYYQGEWKDGKKEGYGYLQIEQFSVFQGSFANNHRSGQGTEEFFSGDSYKGQYERGKFHGKGIYVWGSGSSFKGHFFEGVKQGQGQWRSETGQNFVGQYVHDKKNGYGRYKWQNGTVYQGQFQNDKQHGKGLLTKKDGQQIRGIWENGKMSEILHVQQEQSRLEPKKPKTFETQTIIKVVETKPHKIERPGKLSNV